VNDLRHALRTHLARPGLAIAVISIVAFGIGVNVAIFSLAQQILLRPLPVAAPDGLVNLSDPGPKFGLTFSQQSGTGAEVFSYPMFRDLERDQEPFAGIAAHRMFAASLSTGDEARRDNGFFVSGSYFPLLGIQPALGRLLGPEDDAVDGLAESVVLSHAYWQSQFGADADVIGRRLIVNGNPLTVVGVAPEGFHGTTVGVRASVFVPITFRGIDSPLAIPSHGDRRYYWVYLFARLKPGIDLAGAATAINPLYRSILTEIDAPLQNAPTAELLEEFRAKPLVLEPGARGQSTLFTPARRQLGLLFAVSGTVLLLCCANIAGLLLVRYTARAGEMAVRTSMGATRGRVATLLVAESMLLTLPAAIASLPVAILTLRGIANSFPGLPAAAFDVALSPLAAFVSIGVAVVCAVLLGLVPAVGLIRTRPARILQAYGTRQTSGKQVTRFRAALATVQVALSMSLLAMAGIFAQSLANIGRIDLGLDVDPVVTFSVSPETSGYAPEQSADLFARLEEALAGIPGAASAGAAMLALLSGGDLNGNATVATDTGPVSAPSSVNWVSPGFLRTLGIDLLAGRDFTEADRGGAPMVAIVNESFAEQFGLGSDVVGRRVSFFNELEIVGLAADAKYDEVTGEIGPQVFQALRQSPTAGSASFYVRGAVPPEVLMRSIRDAAAGVDPIVPITELRTMRDQVAGNLATERFVAGAAAAFGALATILAGLGLYGVLAFSVAQRSREIGLRFALGAPGSRIRSAVLRQMARMAVPGIVLGIVIAFAAGRATSSLLYAVEAGDPRMIAAAAVVLTTVMLAAAYFPARRATRVDPMSALRYE
jgi:predicted permease